MKSEKLKKKFKIAGGVATGIGILLMFTNLVGTGFGLICLGLILFFVGMAKTKEETNELINKKSGFRKVLSSLVILLLLIFVGIAIFSGGDESGNTQTQQVSYQTQDETLDEIGAYIQGQYYIKQILKAPASAEFPSLGFIVNRLSNNRYEVVSYVDSQNSFGAMVRDNWNVVFQYENGKTFLERIIFDGKVVYQSK